MARKPKLETDQERELLAWATKESLRRHGMSAREAAVHLTAKLGHTVSNTTVSSAMRGVGGESAIAAIEALLGVKRDGWSTERDAARMLSGTLDPFERYPLLGARLKLARAARALRGDQLPDEVWEYVGDSLRGLALKGEMTEQIADEAIDAAIRQVRQRAEVAGPEAKHVDITPSLDKLKRGKR